MRVLFFFLLIFYSSLLFSSETFKPPYYIVIGKTHLEEMKQAGVRCPLFDPIRELQGTDTGLTQKPVVKYHPCTLTAICIVKKLCSLYKTSQGQITFTLQLSSLTDQLRYESTEAYRNLDYRFDPMTGKRKKSWVEKAKEDTQTKQMLCSFFTLQELKQTRREEHNKIRRYQKIFKTGSEKTLKNKQTNNFLIPQCYREQLEEIEQDFRQRPNPFFVDFLHRKINEIEKIKTRKGKNVWS